MCQNLMYFLPDYIIHIHIHKHAHKYICRHIRSYIASLRCNALTDIFDIWLDGMCVSKTPDLSRFYLFANISSSKSKATTEIKIIFQCHSMAINSKIWILSNNSSFSEIFVDQITKTTRRGCPTSPPITFFFLYPKIYKNLNDVPLNFSGVLEIHTVTTFSYV